MAILEEMNIGGFKIEGTKKKAFLKDSGRYIDTKIVGKLL